MCMYLCYVDESGTTSTLDNTNHFVLAGISIPIWHWDSCDRDIGAIKAKYSLEDSEIHAGWIARTYQEQNKIPQFDSLDFDDRRSAIKRFRKQELNRLQRAFKLGHYQILTYRKK